jgi:hypothetical protein
VNRSSWPRGLPRRAGAVKERVGVQDQYTCAHGGSCLRMTIGEVAVGRIPLPATRLAELHTYLILVYADYVASLDVLEALERTRQGVLAEDLRRAGSGRSGTGGLDRRRADRAFRRAPRHRLAHEAAVLGKVTNARIDDVYRGSGGRRHREARGGGRRLPPPVRAPACRRDSGALPDLHSRRPGFDHEGSRLLFFQP